MNKLNLISRIGVALAAVAFVAVFLLPVWRINLFAPQYPEGLTMYIWINGLSGDVDIINGLNHYIGMQHINPGMFPEFKFLPYVVACLVLLGLLVAFTGSRKLLLVYVLFNITGAMLAIYDFYSWAYDYGHNLDPQAPIQVPGLSYQPPLLGHKKLLNFDAYSMPDAGGWVICGAVALLLLIAFTSTYRHYRSRRARVALSVPVVLLMAIFFESCSTSPEPFVAGRDVCSFCKMGISDLRYGAEAITTKGKIYKFDDLHCLIAFLRSDDAKDRNFAQLLVIDLQKPNTFLDAGRAVYLRGAQFKSPMGSNTAAFATGIAASRIKGQQQAELLDWHTLQRTLKQ
jgi:copper chaperone NosL